MAGDAGRETVLEVQGRPLSLSWHGAGATAVVLGHGAGGTRRTPFLLKLARLLAESGRRAVLYNFPYSEARRKVPDPPALLEAATRAVLEAVRAAPGVRRLVVGGKSMGGRIGSQVAAAGTPVDALVFLGYPLHPPGKPEKLRDAHLPRVPAPMLFVQGTRDDFARGDLLEAVLARLGDRATLVRVEGGDHSFAVLKSSGRTTAAAEKEALQAVLGWLDGRGL